MVGRAGRRVGRPARPRTAAAASLARVQVPLHPLDALEPAVAQGALGTGLGLCGIPQKLLLLLALVLLPPLRLRLRPDLRLGLGTQRVRLVRARWLLLPSAAASGALGLRVGVVHGALEARPHVVGHHDLHRVGLVRLHRPFRLVRLVRLNGLVCLVCLGGRAPLSREA